MNNLVVRFIGKALGIRSLLNALSAKRELGIISGILADNYTQQYLFNNPKYKSPDKLNSYELKVFSQNGEDGIIEEILSRIGVTIGYFVEFGTGNGLQNNTAYLLTKGWSGLWIESDKINCRNIRDKFDFLLEDNTLTLYEGIIDAENVERIFYDVAVPTEFDVLSIDIDGNDYWVWNRIDKYKPKVVVIEYNAHFPATAYWVQKYEPTRGWDGTSYFGASLKSLEDLGSHKGYRLVACDFCGVNAFFVREDLISDRFSGPCTSDNHYEPPRYFLSFNSRHINGFGKFFRG